MPFTNVCKVACLVVLLTYCPRRVLALIAFITAMIIAYLITYIDNSVIDASALNGSRLHLNAKDSSLLAVQFIKFL